jgi:hypothetical protein
MHMVSKLLAFEETPTPKDSEQDFNTNPALLWTHPKQFLKRKLRWMTKNEKRSKPLININLYV